MHDVPYVKSKVGHEITAAMTAICQSVKDETRLPCGVQILSGANKEAIAVANAARLDFVRVEGFVFAHVADEGLMESCAGELLRYRKMIGADNILVFTDIKKKHWYVTFAAKDLIAVFRPHNIPIIMSMCSNSPQ